MRINAHLLQLNGCKDSASRIDLSCAGPTGGRLSSRARAAVFTLILSALLTALFSQAEAVAQVMDESGLPAITITSQRIFFLLFLMLGPIKILVPFVAMTRDTDAAFRGRLATRAIIFSAIALALAGVFGRMMMANFDVSVPVLAFAGGLVLFLVALQTVLQQTRGSGTPVPQFEGEPGMHLALNPLAFPTIVTSYGIAALIVFATLAAGDRSAELSIALIVLVILAMDWAAMIFAERLLRWLGTALQIVAVVLGIAQVAIGLQVIYQSLRLLGLVTGERG